jgi:hypothetical protein
MLNIELKDHVIGVCENLVELDRQLGELSASLVAMRQTLGEVSPDRFEAAYQRHLAGPLSEQIRQAHELGRNVLLATIETLKRSS